MKRLVDDDGKVHFKGAYDFTLCGQERAPGFMPNGSSRKMRYTTLRATCPYCVNLFNTARNAHSDEAAEIK